MTDANFSDGADADTLGADLTSASFIDGVAVNGDFSNALISLTATNDIIAIVEGVDASLIGAADFG